MITMTVSTTEKALTSNELGTLWMVYQQRKMMCRFMEYFIEKAGDNASKGILKNYYDYANSSVNDIEQIFNKEGAVIPVAFGNSDVRIDAPPLYDNMFDIFFLRALEKVALGVNSLYLGMTYRQDIIDFFKRTLTSAEEIYSSCTNYLLEKGVLARAPYVSMPKEVEFVQSEKYMQGFNLFGNKRSLNTIEVAHIHQAIENNIMGMQLMTGFAQVAKEKDVKEYFIKSKELAKKIVSDLSQVLLQSDIQPSASWAGKATDSTIPPFSDKMMMFCTTLLSSFALGSNALGTSLSFRSDLPAEFTLIMKDTFDLAREGAQLMIKHKWLEEPPQMEDRNELAKPK